MPTIGQIRFDLSRLRLAVLPVALIAGFERLDLFRRRGHVAVTDRRRVRVLRRGTPLFVALCLAGMFLIVRPAFHPHKPWIRGAWPPVCLRIHPTKVGLALPCEPRTARNGVQGVPALPFGFSPCTHLIVLGVWVYRSEKRDCEESTVYCLSLQRAFRPIHFRAAIQAMTSFSS